ncbi:MAG: 4-hydroxy-tetrahydrodipicolinate reductase [Clostridiales bacterium]|nr:4-hydroxy-tetrahydrodipicolinate reductase [Clostridiales bacterium]
MKKAFIVGINGKMGKMLVDLAASCGYEISGGLDTAADGKAVFTNAAQVNVNYDVVIDFSRPATLPEVVALCCARGVPAVIATTGYSDGELAAIAELSKSVPVFRSANMSLGIAATKAAAVAAKAVLGDAFDIEIVEKHHNQKADSPSGTALLLADALAPKDKQIFGRDGKRNHGELGITSVRGGGVVGEHEIGFYGEDEIVTVSHSARSRRLFAAGAFKAADFCMGKPAGLYDMDDLVKEILG